MQTNHISLDSFGIEITLSDPNEYGDVNGVITSELHEEPTDEMDTDHTIYNSMMDAIESMILAHACAGIDVTTPAYACGIETAVQACADNCWGNMKLKCSNPECESNTTDMNPLFFVEATVDADRELAEPFTQIDGEYFTCCHCQSPAENE